MRMPRAWIIAWMCVAACGVPARDITVGGDDQPHDARASGDAARDGAATDTPATADAATDAATGGGLDPDLELPPATGAPCTHPGAIGSPECPAVDQVCRYFTPTEGRCESCANCGHLNDPCSTTNECDILFECYQHHCVGFCTLGTTECGAPADCVNIGNATRGVCKP
jgi:hypothetical protein